MIIIVETNFILEWVLQQEQAAACDELLRRCEQSAALSLCIPAFAVAEAGITLERKQGERKKFVNDDLRRQAREVSGAKTLQRFDAALKVLDSELVAAEHEEASRWMEFRIRVLDSMNVIPLDDTMLEETNAIQLGAEVKRFPDALVFATVKVYLSALRVEGIDTEAMFVTRDEDFSEQPVLQHLRKLNCSLINSFEHAVQRLRVHGG
jgi:hypothetical protein